MRDQAAISDIGYGKTVAAAAGGLLSLIILYFIPTTALGPFPAEVWSIAQTLITAAAVYLIPHTIGKP